MLKCCHADIFAQQTQKDSRYMGINRNRTGKPAGAECGSATGRPAGAAHSNLDNCGMDSRSMDGCDMDNCGMNSLDDCSATCASRRDGRGAATAPNPTGATELSSRPDSGNATGRAPSANCHSGHRQRMKERFLSEGLDSFDDHQVLELLLFYGIPMKDTNGLAHSLMDTFGGLSGVFEADYPDLRGAGALGENAALLVKLMPQLAKRYMRDRWKDRPCIDNTAKAGDYAKTLYIGKNYEVFYLICMDSQNRVNRAVPVCNGTINEALVYPRLIVENALRHNANSVILSHNHPGGGTSASKADIEITKRLKQSLEAISVKVMDHIIVAGDQYISFAEKGLL
jgi:DNA repair protein RadC